MEGRDNPIERAARALATVAGEKSAQWAAHVPTVRIVLEALDQPNAAMINAGNEAMRGAWAARGLVAPEVAGDAAVAAAWEAMIDRYSDMFDGVSPILEFHAPAQ